MKVEIYSDIVCPWCYIGKRRFEKALESRGGEEVRVVYRPYQLDPHAPDSAVPLSRYLAARFGGRAEGMRGAVDAAARGEGIRIDWDRALVANTRRAHRLLLLAGREQDGVTQAALAERLFAMHFLDGGDVGDPAQLAAAAADVGMDPERAAGYLASDEGEPELDRALTEARLVGVRAVPTYTFEGRWLVEGAQAAGTFRDVLQNLADRLAAEGGGETRPAG